MALVAFAEDVVGELEPLQSDDVWLVSGGGSGVTAHALSVLLKRVKMRMQPSIFLDAQFSLNKLQNGWIGAKKI